MFILNSALLVLFSNLYENENIYLIAIVFNLLYVRNGLCHWFFYEIWSL